MRVRVAAVLLACSAAGCSMAMRSVPVSASHIQWEALAGEWQGSYQMNAYDRHGTIAFKLVAVEEQASGEVLMIPEHRGWPYTVNHPTDGVPGAERVPKTELLSIQFVEALDGTLSGTMEPYWDPDRRCTARASFTGVIDRDSISGDVVSVCDDGVRLLRGRWRARRNPPVAAAPK